MVKIILRLCKFNNKTYATLFVLYKNVMVIVGITLNCSKSHNRIRVPFTVATLSANNEF